MTGHIFICIFLALCAICDIKRKSVNGLLLLCGAAVSAGLTVAGLITGSLTVQGVLSGLADGGIILLISVLTKERIGRGDAYIVCICMPLVGAVEGLAILLAAFVLAAAAAGVCLAVKRCSLRFEIPFVPFLLGGVIAVMAGGI